MGKTIRFLLQLVSFLIVSYSWSQDLIIRKDGSKLYCEIVKEDSLSIFYLKHTETTVLTIQKSEVANYYFSKTTVSKGVNSKPTKTEFFIVSFDFGRSNPIQNFGSKDTKKEEAGFALPGYSLKFMGCLKVSESFGFNVGYYHQNNRFAHSVFQDELNTTYSNSAFKTQATNWIMRGMFVGFSIDAFIKRVDGLSLNFDVMAGRPLYTLPNLEIRGNPNGQFLYVNQYAYDVRAFTFLGTIGVNYRIKKRITLHVNASYLRGKPEFEDFKTFINSPYVSNFSTSSYSQEVRTINTQIGISFNFFRKVKN